MWAPYKNNQGARRSDGLYLRRARGFDIWWEEPSQLLKGWDLNKGLTILGSFLDQPLDEVVAKVDALLPLGARHPLGPFRYGIVECPSCKGVSFTDGRPRGKVAVVCPHCTQTIKIFVFEYARGLEMVPGQMILTQWTEEMV